MTIDNHENLIINIGEKTQLFNKQFVKDALKAHLIEEDNRKLNFCAQYNRKQEEIKPLKKVYLAIPYSGMEKSSYEQATKACTMIINQLGHNVFSPITHSHPIAKLGVKGTWEYWQKIDYQYLDWADEMWVLIPKEGLTKVISSTGVVAECKYAIKNNKNVIYITIDNEEIIFI